MEGRGIVSFPKPVLDEYEQLKARLAQDSGKQLSTREALCVLLEVTKANYTQALDTLTKLRER